MNVNQVAFCTVTALGVATAASAIAAATTAATVATVAYAILAVGLAGVSAASITAWVGHEGDLNDVGAYFEKMKEHSGVAVAGFVQLFSQTLVKELIQRIANGIGLAVQRAIAGPDVTVGHR